MHRFSLLDVHIDGGERVACIPYFGGVVSLRHVALSHIAQLLSKLELPGYGACGENRFQISASILWRPNIPNVAQELFAHIGREAVENSARRLFPGRKVLVCRFKCCIISSFDIAPVSMADQVLVQ